MLINRNRVGRAFHKYAVEYDLHATVQKRVVDKLMSLVQSHVSKIPIDVLDIGCGTGQLISSMSKQYPNSRLYGLDLAFNMLRCASNRLGLGPLMINGDAEHLPFKDQAFDLIVSTSTLQWIENLDFFFQQSQRILNYDGILCLAFFGGSTLKELHECYREAVEQRVVCPEMYLDRLHRFKEIPDVLKALELSNFVSVQVTSEIEMDFYPEVNDLLRSIKCIGAGSSAQEVRSGGLGWRSIINKTSQLYKERYGKKGMIPVTYEVFYVIATCCDKIKLKGK